MRRHYSLVNDTRLSNVSVVSDHIVGGRNRVSSLTRNQVTTLKQFTSIYFNASSSSSTTTSPAVNRRSQQSSANNNNNRNTSYA